MSNIQSWRKGLIRESVSHAYQNIYAAFRDERAMEDDGWKNDGRSVSEFTGTITVHYYRWVEVTDEKDRVD